MNSPAVLVALHWVSGLIVLAIGLARLEGICLFSQSGMARYKLIAEAVFWVALCIGAGGALVTPLLPLEKPTLQDACVLVGVAGLILCGRLRGHSCQT